MIASAIRRFVQLESAGGLALMGAALLAMIVANSPLAALYQKFLDVPLIIQIGNFGLAKPLLLWINDGLMAVFFLLIGLELKRELVEGELSDLRQLALPGSAAIGGMAVPALIYVWINRGDPIALQGWAIPAATDIAFALGILMLLGKRVPVSLKIFLLSLAIIDDIGAILVIAVFYTADLSVTSLVVAAVAIAALVVMNRRGARRLASYLFIGAILWISVLKSGVHATLAGVILAFFIPLRRDERGHSPLCSLEEDLHHVVSFAILPIFAFANAGVSLAGVSLKTLVSPVPLGIEMGLIFGKQIGVLGFAWLATRLGLARLPEELSWRAIYGVSVLCGIGFTMSLFLASLAFEHESGTNLIADRIGILVATLIAAVWGYAVLSLALRKEAGEPE